MRHRWVCSSAALSVVARPVLCGVLRAGRLRLKCDGIRAETRFRLSVKRTSPFKRGGGGSVQSTTGSRGVRIRLYYLQQVR
jgi:hypothetical protein